MLKIAHRTALLLAFDRLFSREIKIKANLTFNQLVGSSILSRPAHLSRCRRMTSGRFGPFELAGVKPVFQYRLDDLEIRRDVEIAWREQAVVADMQYLAHGVVVRAGIRTTLDARQDRVTDGLEGLCDERRANGAGRVAAAECQHAPAPTHRHRRYREQVACQGDDVTQVGGMAEACG